MFIDIHAHAYWEPNPLVTNFATPEQLIEVYDALNIEKGVLLPIVNPEIYFPQTNEDILNMAKQYPDRFIPFCNIDPRALANSPHAPLYKVMEYYKEKGCKGIGEVMPNLEVMDPMVQNLFECAEKVDMPVIFDGSVTKTGDFGLYDDPGLPQLEFTLQRYPKLKLFGHGPVFWNELVQLVTPGERGVVTNRYGQQCGRLPKGPIPGEGVVPVLMRRYPNLYGDMADGTCANIIMRDEEFGAKFLNEFQDRLFFGTDYCNTRIGTNVITDKLLIRFRDEGKISEEVFKKIAHDNAAKLFGLM